MLPWVLDAPPADALYRSDAVRGSEVMQHRIRSADAQAQTENDNLSRFCHRLPLWFLVLGLLSHSHAGPAGPAEPANTKAATGRERPSLGLLVMHGFADTLNGSADDNYDGVGVRASFPVGQRGLGPSSSVGVEFIPAVWFADDRDSYAGGLHVLYEHRFAQRRAVTPVLRAGTGMWLADQPVPRGATRHNFSLFGGAGVDIALGSRRTLGLEYRFHHLSNADTGDFNPGINAHALVAVLSYRLQP